jgi:hypothetical protein
MNIYLILFFEILHLLIDIIQNKDMREAPIENYTNDRFFSESYPTCLQC